MFKKYEKQTVLMLDCLPICLREEIWALKGGTAINFFYKNLPRLSVDIDLTYLPIKGRNDSLKEMSDSLTKIKYSLKRIFKDISIQVVLIKGSEFISKLLGLETVLNPTINFKKQYVKFTVEYSAEKELLITKYIIRLQD